MVDWWATIVTIYQIIQMTIDGIKKFEKIRGIMPRDYIVSEIREELQSGELHFGDQISVIGTFSEYLPFVDPKFILKEERPIENALPHTARLKPVDDVYCGALFPPDQKDAYAKETIPIFYGIDSPMLNHSTGEMLGLKCKIIQVPLMYRNLISENENFIFEKEDGAKVSFGLEVLKPSPYGLVDSFKINTWLVGNLNPYPEFVTEERNCFNCTHLFSFMKIDPVDYPPRYGCSSPDRYLDDSFTDVLKQDTEEFLNIENEGVPHVVFPNPFALFKVFCPNINLFNNDDLEYSKNLLVTAVKQNIESMFDTYLAFPKDLKIPKSIKCKVDFQYDQLLAVTKQTFDPAKVPRWQCPGYVYDPNWQKRTEATKKTRKKEEKRRTSGKVTDMKKRLGDSESGWFLSSTE